MRVERFVLLLVVSGIGGWLLGHYFGWPGAFLAFFWGMGVAFTMLPWIREV